MMHGTKGFVILIVALCFVGATLSTVQSTPPAEKQAAKEEIKTVTLKKEPVGISPNPLKVKLGTTIVWINSDPEPVTIKFIQKLGVACKVPVNFYSDLFGYYETSPIPQGATASICFIFQGEYDYEVKRVVEKLPDKPVEEISMGKIIAEE